jgi:UDP-N-acetylmuramate--alanine ligase
MDITISNNQHYFFIGIAGSGMSAIAQYLKGIGKHVSGSDRYFNTGQRMPIQDQLEDLGILCFQQDGSGIARNTDVVVVSTAIEDTNPEYKKAQKSGIPVIKRSELLSAISETKNTIAIGGTAGKSTTAAMIFHILQDNGYSPSLITGAGLIALQSQGLPGNAWVGNGEWLVIEADESDGSIVQYNPHTGVLLNIQHDHKEQNELIRLFETFKKNTQTTFIVNRDQEETRILSQNKAHDFSIHEDSGFKGESFSQKGYHIVFKLQDILFNIPVIGKHNMQNALAAVAACHSIGVPIKEAAGSLVSYKGIYRRAQLIGEKRGVVVIDDFAHNPSEVEAAIKACQEIGNKVFAWFQPHGFGPLKFMHQELSYKVAQTLRQNDIFFISDVYYAGGTVSQSIHPDVVQKSIIDQGKQAIYLPFRERLYDYVHIHSSPGDVVLLMGARDPSLSQFAEDIFENL